MDQNKNKKTHPQKRKAGIILICGTALAFLWLWIFPQFLCPLWRKFTFLPEEIYFPIEEFWALNINHNSPIVLIGGFLIIVCTLIWSLKLNGKLQKSYEYILIAVIIFLMTLMLMPCLCAPREVGRRLQCVSELKEAYRQISLYADENKGKLPDTFTVKNSRYLINYYGKGRSLKEAPFVLLEDAQRCHAGDLRHQIWSNGKIKVFHPWKIKNRKIGL